MILGAAPSVRGLYAKLLHDRIEALSYVKPDATEEKQIITWLHDLNSDSFNTRDAASQALEQHSGRVLYLLDHGLTFREQKQPEVIQRLKNLKAARSNALEKLIIDINQNPLSAHDAALIEPQKEKLIGLLTEVIAIPPREYDDNLHLKLGIEALGALGPEAKNAVPALNKIVEQDDYTLKILAAKTLRKIGPAAKDAVPQLIKALQYPRYDVQLEAMNALVAIGKEAVPNLGNALKEMNPDQKEWALSALKEIGPAAKDAVPQLVEALDDPISSTRMQAVRALGAIGPAARNNQSLGKLIELHKNESSEDRKRVISQAIKDITALSPTDQKSQILHNTPPLIPVPHTSAMNISKTPGHTYC